MSTKITIMNSICLKEKLQILKKDQKVYKGINFIALNRYTKNQINKKLNGYRDGTCNKKKHV